VSQQVKYEGRADVTQEQGCPEGRRRALLHKELANKGKKAAAARERRTHG